MQRWRTSTLVAWIRAGAGALAGLAAAYLAWLQFNPQTDPATKGTYDRWAIVAIFTVGIVSVISSFADPIILALNGRFERAKVDIAPALRSLCISVDDLAGDGVDFKRLGASVWVIRGFGRFQYLYRLGRERVSADPQPSHIKWRKGKGIVGECWATERTLVINVGSFDAEIKKRVNSAAVWETLPAAQRRNMKYSEYDKIRGKYGTVIAVPVRDANHDHKVIGVLTLDAPPGAGYHRKLSSAVVTETVSAAALAVARFIT